MNCCAADADGHLEANAIATPALGMRAVFEVLSARLRFSEFFMN
jgi:hypothetical protein